ncbi:MAG: hypothetical protein DRG78_22950, partial [Epsilonproteobacteria bacterium]
ISFRISIICFSLNLLFRINAPDLFYQNYSVLGGTVFGEAYIIDNFIEKYIKKERSEKLDYKEKKIILKTTLDEVKKTIIIQANSMVENISYNKIISDKIYKNYLNIIDNIQKKLLIRQAVTTLLDYIAKAKMDYVLKLDDNKIIYPFIYDLLLYTFLIEIRLSDESQLYVDRKDIFKTLKKVRNNLAYSPEDKRYANIEYLKLAEILTEVEPNELQNYLLYHYSKILDSDYSCILSIFKQLRHGTTDHHRHEYKYKDFSFVTNVALQDFRHYSLYVL